MHVRNCRRHRTRLPALALVLLLLSACASRIDTVDLDWERHQREVAALSDWSLTGRLNVREQNQSDTVQINWKQQGTDFDLVLSGSFGLGAVHVFGSPTLVTVARAGEDATTLPSLAALTREYFGYDFPTAQLQYWVRGIPAPGPTASTTLNENQRLGSLIQRDDSGQQWTLTYDRYRQGGSLLLPGRIRVERSGLRLTFLVDNWQVPVAASAVP